MECSILEQMGEADYKHAVFDFENNTQNFVDCDSVSFAVSQEAADRMREQGEDIVVRENVAPGFRSSIEKWFEDGILLVSCDITNYFYSRQEVYISDSDTIYKPGDYFDGVWERIDVIEE